MIAGFFTAYPVDRWLVRRGWKEKMDCRTHLAEMLEHERRDGRRRGRHTVPTFS
jgi:hypothetical protein